MELKNLCNNQPSISVIATFYNYEKYIRRCVESILAQTYPVSEIILVDDGSDDGSVETLREIAERYQICLLNSGHQGVSVARNMGIDVAHSEYIMFVDGDDYITETIVEELVNNLDGEDMVCCTCECFQEENQFRYQSHFYDGDQLFWTPEKKEIFYSQLMDGSFMQKGTPYTAIGVPWGKLYRKAFLDEYKIRFYPELKRMQDNIFNMEAAYHANRVKYIDKPLYCYRLNNIVQYKSKPYSPEIYKAVLLHRKQIMETCVKSCSNQLENLYYKEKLYFLWLSVKYIAMSVKFSEFKTHVILLKQQDVFDNVYKNKELTKKYGAKLHVFAILMQCRAYRFLYWFCNR